jgi:hypothetical protein
MDIACKECRNFLYLSSPHAKRRIKGWCIRNEIYVGGEDSFADVCEYFLPRKQIVQKIVVRLHKKLEDVIKGLGLVKVDEVLLMQKFDVPIDIAEDYLWYLADGGILLCYDPKADLFYLIHGNIMKMKLEVRDYKKEQIREDLEGWR